jgi:predicted HicB family RNase H-like nuclease
MLADTLTVSIPSPLAEKIEAAAAACGLSVNEWAALTLARRMAEREANASTPTNESD